MSAFISVCCVVAMFVLGLMWAERRAALASGCRDGAIGPPCAVTWLTLCLVLTRGNIRLFGVRPQHGFLARKGKAAALFV
jgi:hypothetical protein